MVPEVNYKRLLESIDYYNDKGYKRINLPWIVDEKYIKLTYKDDNKFIIKDERALLGSAEQAFLKEVFENNLEGRFQCLTPCFRNDKEDNLHFEYFMKNELFIYNEKYNFKAYELILEEMIINAYNFFEKQSYLQTLKIVETSESLLNYDILLNDIEIGSYLIREIEFEGRKIMYVCGTGLAEPRFETAMFYGVKL